MRLLNIIKISVFLSALSLILVVAVSFAQTAGLVKAGYPGDLLKAYENAFKGQLATESVKAERSEAAKASREQQDISSVMGSIERINRLSSISA